MSRALGFVKAHPFGTAMGIGSVGSAAFVTSTLAVEWPEGDPGRLREAAEIWEGLAAAIERTRGDANDAVAGVLANNSGPAVDAFRNMWTGRFAAYPGDIATYCRAVAKACREYAKAVEITRYVLIVLAVQMLVNILFTVAWGWGTAGVGSLVQKQIIEKAFRGRAILQKKLFKLSVEKIIYNSFYYLGDSLGYAGGQQIIQWSIFEIAGVKKDFNGNEVTSLGENAVQFGRGFGANMAFNGVYDLTKVAGVPVGPTANLLSRLTGSAMYTVIDNALQGEPAAPTLEQWIAKIIAHGARTAKPVQPPKSAGP
ncbi:WXG100-like domain-containing protein [Microtetraspora niveoalba]|uniref:WXG100-like domain-containing protein n=1 Tax=Microtetraspora niveoalba TaxID=46175 RepID=UPI000832C521|nr:hypothetical protein [Microtetraspora niveoalba]